MTESPKQLESDPNLGTLRAVLNLLVPASVDGRMPAAGEMAPVLARVAELATAAPVRELLETLQREALARGGTAFAALDEAPARSLLDAMRERDPATLRQLALETVTCYYQQDRVLEALGLQARPPYPKGHQLETGDLSLLAPVTARGRIYRDAS